MITDIECSVNSPFLKLVLVCVNTIRVFLLFIHFCVSRFPNLVSRALTVHSLCFELKYQMWELKTLHGTRWGCGVWTSLDCSRAEDRNSFSLGDKYAGRFSLPPSILIRFHTSVATPQFPTMFYFFSACSSFNHSVLFCDCPSSSVFQPSSQLILPTDTNVVFRCNKLQHVRLAYIHHCRRQYRSSLSLSAVSGLTFIRGTNTWWFRVLSEICRPEQRWLGVPSA